MPPPTCPACDLFHLGDVQTVTNSPQVMGALIVVIANLAALILFYIVKQLSQNGSVALMSFVLCLSYRRAWAF